MNSSFASKYHPLLVEKEENSSYWSDIINNSSPSVSLLMPPPNITGKLHLGHALDLILQDFLTRYFYLDDKPVYWISGIDHAGIATQKKIESLSNIYELKNDEEKKSYTLNTWYPQVRKDFFEQWKKLGLLTDYKNTQFTLDLNIQKQVKLAFVKLYKDGLINRGKRMVNWDPQLKSVISDIEVENKPSESKLYYLKYLLLKLENFKKKPVFFKIARVIIRNEEGKILLVKDKKWGWNFPGGKLEGKESPQEAAEREVFEETNLIIKKTELKKLEKKPLFFNDYSSEVYIYQTKSYLGEIKIKEHNKILEIKFFPENSKEVNECFQYFSIPKKEKYLLVATSRPETIFTDEALFVNPRDKRYQEYLDGNWKIKHPWNDRIIPILADEAVKIDFGTGVLKCTPGHDFVDYDLGKKHNLPLVSCCDEKGLLNDLAGQWKNQEPQKIRQELVKVLKEKNICVKVEAYQTNLSLSQRTGAIVEPLLSTQWFLNLPLLIKKIDKENSDFLNEINFYPLRFRTIIKEWKEKSRGWCISRQLWWGHQIPAWYHKKTGEIYVGEQSPKNTEEWEAERDVLDTWFSSGLWPLTTLSQEEPLSPSYRYFPVDYLITGSDILFFWVLKMILLGYYFTNKVSFKNIYLHGLIKDREGKKMSKSLGNGVEPKEIIDRYGTDSLRLFLLTNNKWGTDLIFEESKIKGAYNFLQKLWSVGNFICLKTGGRELKLKKLELIEVEDEISKEDNLEIRIINAWILTELKKLEEDYSKYGKKLETGLLTKKIIDFVKQTLSNGYLELIKKIAWSSATESALIYVYQKTLIYLNPFIPFITESLYQKFSGQKILS